MEYIQQILMLIGVNLIAVLGLSILTGFTGLFSFGHAGFMAIGAYDFGHFHRRLHLTFALANRRGARRRESEHGFWAV
jgi:branched-chain amino acid transport system permease protein